MLVRKLNRKLFKKRVLEKIFNNNDLDKLPIHFLRKLKKIQYLFKK